MVKSCQLRVFLALCSVVCIGCRTTAKAPLAYPTSSTAAHPTAPAASAQSATHFAEYTTEPTNSMAVQLASTQAAESPKAVTASVNPAPAADNPVPALVNSAKDGIVVPATPEKSVGEKQEPEVRQQSATQQIDLTTALLLTSGQNPQVGLARARIQESLAQLDRARALKLPSISAGISYNKHEGRIQDVAGSVIETSRGSYFHGLGANAVGAGSPAVPGLMSQFHIADAIFLPKIAQRTACARQSGAQAATNDALLATALAYVELLRAQQDLAVTEEVLGQAERLERTTDEFARAGEGLQSDHDRARTELALRKIELLRAEETAIVASVRLAEQIRWDATAQLVPAESHLLPISMMDLQISPQEMVAMALSNRPDLAESRHLVGEAIERLNRERHAPLVPSVLLAASYGGLGGGLGSSLTNYGDRFDADAVAVWEVRQLGVGEQAIRREARSRIQQARQREMANMDRIAREVVESYTQAVSRSRQIQIAEQAVAASQESYEKNWDRIQNGQGLPIEVLQAIQASAIARREYVRVVAEHNVAQFTLYRALGWPVQAPESSASDREKA